MEHHVVGYPAIEIQLTAQAVPEEGEIGTEVGFGDNFPLEVVLVHGLCAHAVNDGLSEDCRRAHAGLAHDVDVVCGDVVVTKHTPAGAEFQVVDALSLHEVLVGNVPSKADGREDAPLLLILGAAVGTEGDGGKVFLLVVVCTAGEGGYAVVPRGPVAGVLVLVGTVAEVAGGIVKVRYAVGSSGEGCSVLHAGRLADHGSECMCADPVGISEGVVQDPVGSVAVCLGQRGNGCSLGASDEMLGSVVLGVVEVEVKVVGGLEFQLLGDCSLCVGRENGLEAGLLAVVVVCGCGRVAVGIGIAVTLGRIELLRICVGVGIGIDSVHGRVHECLVEHAGVGVVAVVGRDDGVEPDLEPAGHCLIQTGAEVDTVIVVNRVVHDTVLVVVAQTHRIVCLLCAAGEIQGMGVGKGGMDQFLVPVCADAVIVGNVLCGSGGNLGEVVHLHVLLRICHLEDVGGDLETGIAVVGHPHAAGFTLLGSDQDDAVRCAHTVDCGCRCVLEDGEGLDIARRQEIDVVHEGAVNDVQRIGIVADGAYAADLHGRAGTGGAALCDLDAGYHALEGAHGVGGRLLGKLVTLHVHDRGGEVLGLLGTVTHNHDLVKEVGVLFEDNLCGDCRCRENLRSIADAAHLNHGRGALHR